MIWCGAKKLIWILEEMANQAAPTVSIMSSGFGVEEKAKKLHD